MTPKLVSISEDRTIATFEEIEDPNAKPCQYQSLLDEEYQEVATTPNMIRRALDEFEGEEEIFFGISKKHPDTFGAALIRIKTRSAKIVLLAGRGETGR